MSPPQARLDGAESARRLFEPLLADRPVERLLVAYLADENRLSRLDTFDEADDRQIGLPLRHIVAQSLHLRVRAVVLAHNHPSGDPRPTRADLDATRVLASTLKPLGIRVRDHLIYGGGAWASLRLMGLL